MSDRTSVKPLNRASPRLARSFRSGESLVALIASAVSLAAFFHFFRAGELLLYGDAVAHLNIARRVVDSITPGPLQLGTVWLPLPHLLMLPFVWIDWAWRTGAAGAIPSMLAYVLATVAVYRVTSLLASQVTATVAAIVFAANPNLLYMQSVAMTEAIYLATFLWAATHFVEFTQSIWEGKYEDANRALNACALWLFAGVLTRYDGWFLAVAVSTCVLLLFLRQPPIARVKLKKTIRNFVLLTSLGPALWLGYNFGVFGNPLEFAVGKYSAHAIEAKSSSSHTNRHPGDHNLRVATAYFVKDAKLNLGDGRWQHWMFIVAAVATLFTAFQNRRRSSLILWAPLPFYVLSIAFGDAPIFMPVWWPFSYYNVRYGLQLLPAASVFVGLALEFVRRVQIGKRFNHAITFLTVLLVAGSYWNVWRSTPICLREARANSSDRIYLEHQLSDELRKLPHNARLLMYMGGHSGAVQQAGIPFNRVLNEGNYPFWGSALEAPADSADYVVAIDEDPVAQAIARNGEHLQPLVAPSREGKPVFAIFRSLSRNPH